MDIWRGLSGICKVFVHISMAQELFFLQNFMLQKIVQFVYNNSTLYTILMTLNDMPGPQAVSFEKGALVF